MSGGDVNRALLASFYQNYGDVYDDTKTESALGVLADQMDLNWADFAELSADGGIKTDNLDDQAVTREKIALGAIGPDQLQLGLATPVDIAAQLSVVNAQLADKAIQVEVYGAVGDGTTSDSIAFQNAINKALTTRNPTIQLQPGKIYLLKASDVATYSGVSIIGNGANLKFDGIVRFALDNLDTFLCNNLSIETNIGFTEDDTYAYNHMFYLVNQTKEVLYDIEGVRVKSIASQSPKISRYPSVFGLSHHKRGSRMRNIFFENIGGGIVLFDGEGVEISNIRGVNIETLVYMRNPKSSFIYDLGVKNTHAQSLTWIGKTGGSGGSNGKDTLMIEGGDDISIHHIYGEFCIERVIYCQSSNVKADNLYAKNCAGFKFCGSSYAARVSNVEVRNINKIMTDDLITIVDSTIFFGILEMYYVTNAEVDGITLRNYRTDKLTQEGTYVISIADGTHDIRVKNVDVEINTPIPLIYFFVLQDNTKTCTNITIENFTIRNYGSSAGDYCIFNFGGTTPVSWIDGLKVINGKVIQDEVQIIAKDISRRGYSLLTKKAVNVTIDNVDEGYINYITSLQDTPSSYDSSNILKVKSKSRTLIGTSDNNFNLYYYSGHASGAATQYLPKVEIEQLGINYKTRSSFYDTIRVVYQNKSTTTIRLYDSVINIEFDMLLNGSLNDWALPLNVVGQTYLVEVESSVGCGKAIFAGSTVTEMYKTGNLVFDSTASKLRVRPSAGSGTDYFININNASGITTRVKVKVTLLNTL